MFPSQQILRKIVGPAIQWSEQLVMFYPLADLIEYIVVHKGKLHAFYVMHFTTGFKKCKTGAQDFW